MSKSVSIIACGPTNRLAMLGSLKRIGCKVQQITSPADIIAAKRIILYGDGLFPDAIARLNRDGLSGSWGYDEKLGKSARDDGSIIMEDNNWFCGDHIAGYSVKTMVEY